MEEAQTWSKGRGMSWVRRRVLCSFVEVWGWRGRLGMDGLIGWVGYRTTPIDGVFVAFCVRACLLPPLAPVHNLFGYLRFGFSPRLANAPRAVVVVVFQTSADERFFLRPKERRKKFAVFPYFPGWRDIYRAPLSRDKENASHIHIHVRPAPRHPSWS